MSENQIKMLGATAEELIGLMNEESDDSVTSVKQCAFDYFHKESNCIWQVQIIVTRDELEHLGLFEAVVERNA